MTSRRTTSPSQPSKPWREIIEAGLKTHPELRVTIKSMTERGGSDDNRDPRDDIKPVQSAPGIGKGKQEG